MKYIVGIDHSTASSGVCISPLTLPFEIRYLDTINCPLWVKAKGGEKIYFSNEERINRVVEALTFLRVFDPSHTETVFFEEFAFGAPGRITQLAQGQGVLRYYLRYFNQTPIPFKTISPATVKKHATGHGHTEKSSVIVHIDRKFREPLANYGIEILTQNDMADALSICHFGWTYHMWKSGNVELTKDQKKTFSKLDDVEES